MLKPLCSPVSYLAKMTFRFHRPRLKFACPEATSQQRQWLNKSDRADSIPMQDDSNLRYSWEFYRQCWLHYEESGRQEHPLYGVSQTPTPTNNVFKIKRGDGLSVHFKTTRGFPRSMKLILTPVGMTKAERRYISPLHSSCTLAKWRTLFYNHWWNWIHQGILIHFHQHLCSGHSNRQCHH